MQAYRRTFLGSWLARWWPLGAAPAAAAASRSVYDELGVRPVINFAGTHTTVGASKQWPELHAAMEEASRHFVSLDEMQDRVGERLSRLIGSDAAMVTTGAAGAITLGTCASVAGADKAAIRRLPDLSGLKDEVVIFKLHRNGYDHAVRSAGVRIVDVETAEQLERALTPRVAMMYYLGGSSLDYALPEPVPIATCLPILRKAGVPMLVDTANMLPTWENIRNLARAGVDLIAISGGKHMRGPQCSGILAGRKDLVAAARLHSSPHSDSLGRPFKVGREEIAGVWLAAEKYAKLDFDALDRECLRQAETMRDAFNDIRGLRASLTPTDRTRKIRRVAVQWDEQSLGLTATEAEKRLWDGNPRLAVQRHSPQGLLFTAFMNDPGDEKLAIRRMRETFRR